MVGFQWGKKIQAPRKKDARIKFAGTPCGNRTPSRLIRSQALYPAELRARPRGKPSYYKGNPASTAFQQDPNFTPKQPVVCAGFAVHVATNSKILSRQADLQAPNKQETGNPASVCIPFRYFGVPKGGLEILRKRPQSNRTGSESHLNNQQTSKTERRREGMTAKMSRDPTTRCDPGTVRRFNEALNATMWTGSWRP